MRFSLRSSRRAQIAAIGTVALLVIVQSPLAANATTLVQLSTDIYTNSTSMHKTQVEPAIFAYGGNIVAAFQSGRFSDGGSSNLGWATSKDAGATWTHGFLPGTTVFAGGGAGRISDPSVTYDAKHKTWLIEGLPINAAASPIGVWVSRSTDQGITWSNPVTVSTQSGTDKTWINCDDWPKSPYYGHCYGEWDNNAQGNVLNISTSTDGGVTWGPAKNTADHATGTGAMPLVQPNGTVIVPGDNATANTIQVFSSTNGGTSWSKVTTVTSIQRNTTGSGLRAPALPSAAIDHTGKVYVVWSDCRFEKAACASSTPNNDIVMVSSTDGTTWSAVTRIPIDALNSNTDHFLPGLGIDETSQTPVHMALSFYDFPKGDCSPSTCQLEAGFIASADGGNTWSPKVQVGTPMKLSWLPLTTQGNMVGDYTATSYSNHKAWPVYALASANSGLTFNESIYTATK